MSDAVARGRGLIGVRFRPQGRSAEHGLDCIGFVAAAFGLQPSAVPANYRLRGGELQRIEHRLRALRFTKVGADLRSGDLVIMEAGPRQLHLALRTEQGVLHADAGLGRVVERPGEPPWPVLSAWRREPGSREE